MKSPPRLWRNFLRIAIDASVSGTRCSLPIFMCNTMDLRYRRQQVFDVAAPARGVLALPVAADHPIKHTFDPAANPARRLRLGLPNRFEDLHDERRIDGVDRKIADDRIDIGLKRRRP